VIVDPDGKISWSVDRSFSRGSYRRFVLLRYNANGTLKHVRRRWESTTDFGISAFGKDILRDPAGNYVVGGIVGTDANVRTTLWPRYTLRRPRHTFGTNPDPGHHAFNSIGGHAWKYGIARQADGKILFAGIPQRLAPSIGSSD